MLSEKKPELAIDVLQAPLVMCTLTNMMVHEQSRQTSPPIAYSRTECKHLGDMLVKGYVIASYACTGNILAILMQVLKSADIGP